jgi:hypothetical protein
MATINWWERVPEETPEQKYHYLRKQEFQELEAELQCQLQAEEMEAAIAILQEKVKLLKLKAQHYGQEVQDVRGLLKARSLEPKGLTERDISQIREKAEDKANFEFYCLGSDGAKKRAAERDAESRKYREAQGARGYDDIY